MQELAETDEQTPFSAPGDVHGIGIRRIGHARCACFADESMQMPETMTSANANGVLPMYGMTQSGMHMDMSTMDPAQMPSTTDIGTPMTREGSGTSWMPDSTRMYGRMWGRGDDMEMIHGALFLRYIDMGSSRGDRKLVAPGWFMYMRTHPTSPNAQLGIRAMITPDTSTVGGSGYPDLFQTGETWHGQPLHDTQHPHDLFSELAATYSIRITPKLSTYLYAGYPGEPALGPPVYMHRTLAYDLATAPIGHHWEDSTHITFGVLTAGLSSTRFKIEGSSFTGSEPDEVRTNFDAIHLDSSSARVSWNPNRYVSTQISSGFIKDPESLQPGVDVRRTTASILYERPLLHYRSWSQAFVFGQNSESDGKRTNAFLYETDFRVSDNAYFARFERVQKTGDELVLAAPNLTTTYLISVFTAGTVHDLAHMPGSLVAGVGFDISYYVKPAALTPYYGAGNPLGFEVFLRIRPPALAGQQIAK